MASKEPELPDASPLDDHILASADAEWRHVALLIARVMDACKAASIETTGQAIAARIYALVEQGRLAAQGNVRRWRAGKIRAAGVVDPPAEVAAQSGAEPKPAAEADQTG